MFRTNVIISSQKFCLSSLNLCRIFRTQKDFSTETPEGNDYFPSDEKNEPSQFPGDFSYRPPLPELNKSTVVLFPGQGSQFVGMGAKMLDTPGVNNLFSNASKILGYDLLDLCLNGPKEKINSTIYCQPATVVCSLAAVQKLNHEKPEILEHCVGTAGFSVGEISALCLSGAISFEDAIHIVKVRAEQMMLASEAVSSGMMSIFTNPKTRLGLALKIANKYCKEKCGIAEPICKIANYLFADCKVIAGHTEALDFIERNASEFGITRCKRLPVSGAFHTPLMKPAVDVFRGALHSVDFDSPKIWVHSNLTGLKYKSDKKNFIRTLVSQMVKPVKWEQTMHVLYSRADNIPMPVTYECGPGRQLGSILRYVNRRAFNHGYYNIAV